MAIEAKPTVEALQRLEKKVIRGHFIGGIALALVPFVLRALATSLGETISPDQEAHIAFLTRPFEESLLGLLPGFVVAIAYLLFLKSWMARRGLKDDAMVKSWFAFAAGIVVVYAPWYVATYLV